MATSVMRASPAQRERIKLEEGWRLEAYQDTVGIWTIGAGHAATNPIPVRGLLNGEFYEGPPVKGLVITPQEADRLLALDLDEAERGISALIPDNVQLSQGQFDALIDFVHQYGLAKFETSTLRLKINYNPASPLVLSELMRWTQAGGEHREYVWRRSARRCCIYTGTPIPQKLWRKASTVERPTDGYPFALKNDGGWRIDYSKTPSVEAILEDGKRGAKKPDPVVNKSWQEIIAENSPDASVTIITDATKELVLDQPVTAEPATGAGKGGGAPVAPQPDPVAPPAPHGKEPAKTSHDASVAAKNAPNVDTKPGAASPAPGPAGGGVVPHSLPPPVPKVPDPPVPIGQQREAVEAGTRPQDWSSSPKAMILSRRAWGLFLVLFGRLWMLKTGSNAVLGTVSDPLVMEMFSGFMVMMVGEVIQWWGEKKATRPLK